MNAWGGGEWLWILAMCAQWPDGWAWEKFGGRGLWCALAPGRGVCVQRLQGTPLAVVGPTDAHSTGEWGGAWGREGAGRCTRKRSNGRWAANPQLVNKL